MQGLAEARFDIAMTAIDNVVAYQEGQGEAKIPPNPDMFAFMGSDNGFCRCSAARTSSLCRPQGKKLSVDALTTGFGLSAARAAGEEQHQRVGGRLRARRRRGAAVQRAHEGYACGNRRADAVRPDRAGARGHQVLARADEHLGAYLGIVGAARRSGRRTMSRRWSASSVPITRGATSTTRRTATWRRRCWSPTCAP